MNNKTLNFYGVPCSGIKDRLNPIVNCTSESEAMSIAAGAITTGHNSRVYMQNSGIANCIDVITSLYKPYGIPLPDLLLSIRNSPKHHKFISDITIQLLKLLEYDNYEAVYQQKDSNTGD